MEQIRLNCVHKHAYPDQSLSTESLLAGPIHMISNQSKHLVLHSLRAWGIAPVPVSADPLTPVFFAELLQGLPAPPFINAIGVALICIFSLGIFPGKIQVRCPASRTLQVFRSTVPRSRRPVAGAAGGISFL